MSLTGAFSEGATDFLTRMANIKFPIPIFGSTLSHLPARSRWMDWTMRIIQRNVLESVGAAVTSGIRLWKATAPTALHRDNMTENTEWRYRRWPTGSRRSTSPESGIPPEISIYSDSGWDSSNPSIPLDESRKDIPRRNVPSSIESTCTDDRVSDTSSDVEIDMDHLLEDPQRAMDLLTTGTQTEKKRFADLLLTRRDQDWEAQRDALHARRKPHKPPICRYAQRLGINPSLIHPLYELPIDTIVSPQKKSHQGITIRGNRQSMSAAKNLSPYLNRTESPHSSNSKRAPNMIPCFPPNMIEDYTDEHPCGIALNHSSTLHITDDSPPNTSQIRTRSTTKQLNHCLENRKGGYYLRYTTTGKRSYRVITDSSQDD